MRAIAFAVLLAAVVGPGANAGAQARPQVNPELLVDAFGDAYAPALKSDLDAPPLLREFRGAWIATVDNIDWPSKPGLPVDVQKEELLALLDASARLRLNAVIFQVRPAADALYESSLEPWSVYLTGRNGRPPKPEWDPLAFAVAEAHRRGLELHAWFNPYRARFRSDRGPLSPKHVSRSMSSVVKRYGAYLWMDPGEARVRDHTTKVILDVVRRYDIDGVHIDDYFYPYPESNRRGPIPFPDDASFNKYRKGGGKLDRDSWRRQNVDRLVEQLYRGIKGAKPWVKFGISPFGIWRPGYPASVRGLDAYDALYADSRRWLVEGWLDYFTPQLYWAVDAPQQSYPQLLEWWAAQNQRGRHLWPGNGTYKVADFGSTRWPANEMLRQITITRDRAGAGGNVHYNMGSLVRSTDALADRLLRGPYAQPALVPASPWLSTRPPSAPQVTVSRGTRTITLRISADRSEPRLLPRWWLIRARYADGWRAQVFDARSGTVTLTPGGALELPDFFVVNSIDRAGIESSPVRFAHGVRVTGQP